MGIRVRMSVRCSGRGASSHLWSVRNAACHLSASDDIAVGEQEVSLRIFEDIYRVAQFVNDHSSATKDCCTIQLQNLSQEFRVS